MGSSQHLAASRRNVARRPSGREIGGGRSPAPKFLALGLGPFQLALKAQALRLTLGLRPWHSKDGEPIDIGPDHYARLAAVGSLIKLMTAGRPVPKAPEPSKDDGTMTLAELEARARTAEAAKRPRHRGPQLDRRRLCAASAARSVLNIQGLGRDRPEIDRVAIELNRLFGLPFAHVEMCDTMRVPGFRSLHSFGRSFTLSDGRR